MTASDPDGPDPTPDPPDDTSDLAQCDLCWVALEAGEE
jgi:hypothetical protein